MLVFHFPHKFPILVFEEDNGDLVGIALALQLFVFILQILDNTLGCFAPFAVIISKGLKSEAPSAVGTAGEGIVVHMINFTTRLNNYVNYIQYLTQWGKKTAARKQNTISTRNMLRLKKTKTPLSKTAKTSKPI